MSLITRAIKFSVGLVIERYGELVETTKIGVSLVNGETKIVEAPRSGDAQFVFELQSNCVKFGETIIEQFRLDNRSIYPSSRNKNSRNYDELVNFWWEACRQDGSAKNLDVCESLILVKILPRIRPDGSRRIFLDSKVGKYGRDSKWE